MGHAAQRHRIRPPPTACPGIQALRRFAETLRTTLLGHPGVLPLFFARPAVTPQTLKAVENGLRVLTEAGFALPRALDMINVLSIFVVGHAMAEVGTAELSQRGDPGSAAALAQLDVSDLPLVIQAARLTQDADDQADSCSVSMPFSTASLKGKNQVGRRRASDAVQLTSQPTSPGQRPVIPDVCPSGAIRADGGHRDQNRYRLVHRPAAARRNASRSTESMGRPVNSVSVKPGVTELTRQRGKARAYWMVSMFSAAFDIG